MFKQVSACAVIVGLSALAGCSGGGTSATGGGPTAKDQFKIEAWHKNVTVKKGESTSTEIAIDRGKDFKDAVSFKLEDNKKGLKFDDETPKIGSDANKTAVKITAEKDADIGKHTITVTGTPAKGDTAKGTFTVEVE